jgi:hypothetical protein
MVLSFKKGHAEAYGYAGGFSVKIRIVPGCTASNNRGLHACIAMIIRRGVKFVLRQHLVDFWLHHPNAYRKKPGHEKLAHEIIKCSLTFQLHRFVSFRHKEYTVEQAEHHKQMDRYDDDKRCQYSLDVRRFTRI